MTRILIIDDSEVIRNLLQEFLSDLGHKVDLAYDGHQGKALALENDYDAIFCDVHMPKLNGYEVFRSVIAIKPKSRFIMTDSLPDELADMAVEQGAYCCLSKPFDLDQVRETLDKLLNKSQKV